MVREKLGTPELKLLNGIVFVPSNNRYGSFQLACGLRVCLTLVQFRIRNFGILLPPTLPQAESLKHQSPKTAFNLCERQWLTDSQIQAANGMRLMSTCNFLPHISIIINSSSSPEKRACIPDEFLRFAGSEIWATSPKQQLECPAVYLLCNIGGDTGCFSQLQPNFHQIFC